MANARVPDTPLIRDLSRRLQDRGLPPLFDYIDQLVAQGMKFEPITVLICMKLDDPEAVTRQTLQSWWAQRQAAMASQEVA